MINEIINKIKWLLDTDITSYEIAKQTGQHTQFIDRYRKNPDKIGGMSLDKAGELEKYIKDLEKTMYKLIVKEEGAIQSVENFETFKDLKQHLISNDYFGWINEEEPERELPNFEDVETVVELQEIFEKYDCSWWKIEVEVK